MNVRTRHRSPQLRRLAIALALAQLAVFTVAPVLEGVVAARSQAAVGESVGTTPASSVLAHDPGDCAACSLLHAKAWNAHEPSNATPDVSAARFTPHGARSRPAQAVNRSVLSRAPPVAFV